MTDQPTNHIAEAELHFEQAGELDRETGDAESLAGAVPALLAIGRTLQAIHEVLIELRDEDLASTPLDDDTVEIEQPAIQTSRYGVGHIPDADIVAGFGPTWDNQPGGPA